MNFLSGYKTYITAAVIAGLAAAQYLGVIDASTANQIVAFLTALGLIAARIGTVKTTDKL